MNRQRRAYKAGQAPDVNRCPKVTYKSRKIAQAVSAQMMGTRVYRCRTCGLWHLTTSPKRKNNKTRGF